MAPPLGYFIFNYDKYCSVDLDGGGSVKALKVNVGGIGQKTQLSVRPERVTVNIGEKSNENNNLEYPVPRRT